MRISYVGAVSLAILIFSGGLPQALRAEDAPAKPAAETQPSGEPASKEEEGGAGDSLMRFLFHVNKGIDTLVVRPATTFYQSFTPPEAQEGVHNVVTNLRTPVVLGNDLLQGEYDRAGVTLNRAFINTTEGFLGWNDEAAKQGLSAHDEDFGQTMGTWGVNEGDYIVLPILGPSTSRDAMGAVVDFFTTPPIVGAVAAADKRARLDKDLESIEKTSVDHYSAVRSLYLQNRRYEVANQKDAAGAQTAGGDFPTLSVEDLENK